MPKAEIRHKIRGIDIDTIYQDQALKSSPGFFACYTPMGIRMKDSAFSRRIMDIGSKREDPRQLAEEIRECKHLHKIIRENLLHNLKNYMEQAGIEMPQRPKGSKSRKDRSKRVRKMPEDEIPL